MSSVRDAEEEPLIAALPLLYRLVLASANPKRLGLTKTQLIIMLSLAHFGTLRMSQIAATCAAPMTRRIGRTLRSGSPRRAGRLWISGTAAFWISSTAGWTGISPTASGTSCGRRP